MIDGQVPTTVKSSGQAEIYVLENPDGIYIAQVKGRPGLQAEGSTAQEAEDKLIDLLEIRRESGEYLHREVIASDPDGVIHSEDE